MCQGKNGHVLCHGKKAMYVSRQKDNVCVKAKGSGLVSWQKGNVCVKAK